MPADNRHLDVLTAVLDSARMQDYAGYSKFDALNSPLLDTLSLGSKWGRLLLTQAVKECPFHVRPLLGVRTSRNPKGIALFARAHLFLYEAGGDRRHLAEAEDLLDWLLDNPSPGNEHLCWGYNFIWQSPLFLQDRYEPNAVVTVFAGEAFVHAYRVTREERYLDAARSVADFICKDLPVLAESDEERAIAYVLRDVKAVVLNNQVMTGALLAKVWSMTGDDSYLGIARRQLTYTWRRRTPYGCWYYTHPRGKSPIRHDNYHTGGILDGFLEYWEETGDERFQEVYWQGLSYYREKLFEADGAPRWMNDRSHPYDVHGSAQGIISFAKAARHRAGFAEQAGRVADWATARLYRPASRDFAYRQGRVLRWNYSLMRWCNAWMARGLGELVLLGTEGDAAHGDAGREDEG